MRFSCGLLLATPFLPLLFSVSLKAEQAVPGVVVYDTHGSGEEREWTVVSGLDSVPVPGHTVLENGLIRITYPARMADPRSGYDPLTERASHLLLLKLEGEYVPVQDANFGDWTYVGGPFDTAPTGFRIVENSVESCTVSLSFGDHRMSAGDSERPGAAAPVTKTITLRRGEFGYVVRVRVGSTDGGEREIGFGGTRTHLFNYTASAGQKWQLGANDVAGCCNYKFPKPDGGEGGDFWAVGLAPSGSYYRLVALDPHGPSASAALRFSQFHTDNPDRPGTAGSIIHYTRQGLEEYEAYVAAVPYDGAGAAVEEEDGDTVVVRATRDGVYTIYSNVPGGEPGDNTFNPGAYIPALRDVKLVAGLNRIPKGGIKLVRPIIAPVSNGSDFPKDIAEAYARGK